MEIFWVILVLQAIICGVLSTNLAEHKGHSTGAWFAAGFFFGIFGLIAAAGLATKQQSQSAPGLIKKCPDCAETIHMEALTCKFCGKKFSKDQIVSDLIVSLQDKSAFNKSRALDALRNFKDPSVAPHVIKLVDTIGITNDSDPNVQLLDRATKLLTELGAPSTSAQLAAILKKTDSIVKAKKLIEILGFFPDPNTIPVLVESLQRQELRNSVANSLKRLGEPVLPYLERLVINGKHSDKKLAQQIITSIKSAQLK